MPHPKVKISDNSGNEVAVTGNALDVNIASGDASIDIGDVSLLLGGTAADHGAGAVGDPNNTLRVTLASDDPAVVDLAAMEVLLGTIDIDTGSIAGTTNGIGDVPNVIGTSGLTGPPKAISVAGTRSGGGFKELLVDSDGNLQIDVVSAPSTAVTNAGTFAVQSTLQASDGVDIGDVDVASLPSDTFKATGTSFEKGVLIQGSDGSDRHNVRTNASGYLMVDIVAASTGGSVAGTPFKIDGESYDTASVGIMNKVVCSTTLGALQDVGDGEITSLQVNGDGALYVEVTASTALTVDLGSNNDVTVTSGSVGHDITGMVSDVNADVGETAEKIHTAADVAIKRIDIQAHPDNTGYIFVGDSGVAGNGSGGGIRLAAGDFYSLDIDNTGDVYVASSVADEDVSYIYYT